MDSNDDIPVYPLTGILNMSQEHLLSFKQFLGLTSDHDLRGQIALGLNKLGKLSMIPPIDSTNLATLISVSLPNIKEGTDPAYPKVDRYQRMLYYLTRTEFAATIGVPMAPVIRSSTDPTTTVDPTIEVEDRELYFETGIYSDSTGSSFHETISMAAKLDGQVYLLYGTIKPDLSKNKEIAKRLYRDLGWMPDIKSRGWARALKQMGQHLEQTEMVFVGLIAIEDQNIIQINSDTILHTPAIDNNIIPTDAETLVAAARDNVWVEDHFGNLATNEGIWFEIPILDTISPTTSKRCSHETEIIGLVKFKVIELAKVLLNSGCLRLPKLKTNTLYL